MAQKSLPHVLRHNQLLIAFSIIGFLSFVVPFSLGHPQVLVGTIVNASLFLAATFLPTNFIYPIIFFPSLAVISRGFIFGPLTSFLFLIIPFIWLGNWFLVFSFKKIFNQTKSGILSVFGAAILKALFLFSIAFILVNLKVLPRPFLTAMGAIQLITAILGGLVSLLAKEVYARNT